MNRFALFLVIGGLAATVNWLSRFAYERAMPFSVAVIVAYATGMVVAFLMFRRFVFPGSPQPLRQQVMRFCLVNAAGMAQTWIVAMLLVEWAFPRLGMTFHPEAIGHGIAIAAPVASSWFAHRHFTFSQKPDPRIG